MTQESGIDGTKGGEAQGTTANAPTVADKYNQLVADYNELIGVISELNAEKIAAMQDRDAAYDFIEHMSLFIKKSVPEEHQDLILTNVNHVLYNVLNRSMEKIEEKLPKPKDGRLRHYGQSPMRQEVPDVIKVRVKRNEAYKQAVRDGVTTQIDPDNYEPKTPPSETAGIKSRNKPIDPDGYGYKPKVTASETAGKKSRNKPS